MTRIHLVRHGSAAAAWTEAREPGLSALGIREARLAAQRLADLGPLPLVTSPLRRARETAAAFERLWKSAAVIDTRLAEIPLPESALPGRGQWLQRVQSSQWSEFDGSPLEIWRRRLIEWAASIQADTVAVSHFMAINVLVGWARGSERLVCCQPLAASCTTLERAGAKWLLVPP